MYSEGTRCIRASCIAGEMECIVLSRQLISKIGLADRAPRWQRGRVCAADGSGARISPRRVHAALRVTFSVAGSCACGAG